eukprot:gene35425-43678_t
MRYGAFHVYHDLVNFLVHYDAMGVDHFILYDSGSATPFAYKLLNDAVDIGLSIEVRAWNMRERHGCENHQTIFAEACAYEAYHQGYENLLVCDYDEALSLKQGAVPGLAAPTLRDFIHYYDTIHPQAAMYVFENRFFPMEGPPDAVNITGDLISLRK